MAQITLNDPGIISKIQSDAGFRKQFATNTAAVLKDAGHDFDPAALDKVLQTQTVPNRVQAASTAIIITIF